MIYTTKYEVAKKLSNLNISATGLETQLIFNYVRNKDYSDEDIRRMFKTIKHITLRQNARTYYIYLMNNILKLLEDKNFDETSIERMTNLITSLANNNFEPITEEQLTFLFKEIDSERKYSPENVKKLITGAKCKYILSSQFDKTKNPNIIEILNNERLTKSFKTFISLYNAFSNFKSQLKKLLGYYSHENINNIIKKCWQAIKMHNDGINANFRKFTEEEIGKLFNFGNIYEALIYLEDSNTNFSDETITKLANRYGEKEDLHMKKTLSFNLRSLIENLTANNQPDNEKFSLEEMRELISNNFKLVYKDTEKAHIVREILKNYINTLTGSISNKAIEELTIKEIIQGYSSLLLMKPYNVYESTQLLLGNNVVTTFNNANENKSNLEVNYTQEEGTRWGIRKKLAELFPNIKISNITDEKQLEIVRESPQILTHLTLFRIHEVMTSLIDVIYSAYGLEEKETTTLEEKRNKLTELGFDCNSFFDGDNIIEIFSNSPFVQLTGKTSQHRQYLSENIAMLSQYLSTQEIQEVIKHNYEALTQIPQILFEKISILQKECNNNRTLKDKLINLLGIENYINKDCEDLLSHSEKQTYAKQLEELISSTRSRLEEIISQPLTQTTDDENAYNKTYNYLIHKLKRINNQYKALSEQLNSYENAK